MSVLHSTLLEGQCKVHKGKDSDSFLVFNISYYTSYRLVFLEMRIEASHYVIDFLAEIV